MGAACQNALATNVLGVLILTGAGAVGAAQPSAGAAAASDLVIDSRSPQIKGSRGFEVRESPYVRDGRYLVADAQNAAAPAAVQVAAPEGDYFVYLTWVRHPQGARDVTVRLPNAEVRIDQSRLANGRSPDEFGHDDMPQFQGLCTSGLFRLTDTPLRFRPGDVVEVRRSDSAPGTCTSFESLVFSPELYLDDLGNDAQWTGTPMLNLKDYGRTASGEVGSGLAFLRPEDKDATIQWTIPVSGAGLLSANPNRGPSRAETIVLEIETPGGKRQSLPLAGKCTSFGRSAWQDVAVLSEAKGAKVRVGTAAGGVACVDLLRFTLIDRSRLVPNVEPRFETFTVQWEDASPARPWLRAVAVVPVTEGVRTAPLTPAAGLPHGVQVQIPQGRLAALDAPDGSALTQPASGSFRVELADDYGVTLSAALLRREPFVWLKDLGIFASREGDFASHQAARQALEDRVAAGGRSSFYSTSEKYFARTGYDEARPRQDDRAFDFAYDTSRPPEPRVSAWLAALPEADYESLLKRVEEPKHRRMFLGWPNVCQEFYVLSNGAIGVSSNSAHGTGHPPAQHFVVQFGVGDPPVFIQHGDPAARQRLEDGYQVIVHTEWAAAETTMRLSAFAYPLTGEEVRTGYEPLGAFVRLVRRGPSQAPLWLRITPDHWEGPKNPLPGLAGARLESARLLAGDRSVLAFAHARATIVKAADEEVLVKLEPEAGRPGESVADLVVPYVAVDPGVLGNGLALGFGEAMSRTQRYWNQRLAGGARIDVPDQVVNDLYKTLYPRTLICGDLDVEGDYALKTSPIVYDSVWLHATAYGIEGLARRGHFEEARQYLEAAFHWQSSQPSDSQHYTTWKGFFNAPPRYTALLWINYHGWMQWAAARYCLFSGDEQWLQRKLPALIESLQWTTSQRQLTMRTNADGSQPPNYGWLPPGRVTDGSAGTSTFSDCINWMGCHELTGVLERVGHPRAAEFRAVADDYRACIVRGLRRACAQREPVRLNDGTFVPYVPGYLESGGHEETMWYAAVVDGALEGILDSGILPSDEPLESWVLQNLEDNLFVMGPNLADEAYFLGHAFAYLRRDQPQAAVYTLYGIMAAHMSRQTLTTFEHRSWGAGRVYDLAPWPMGYFTRLLAGMLCWDEGDELCYGRATPRAWLDAGKRITVEGLQTRFGPTSFRWEATADRVTGTIELPPRPRPPPARLRLRLQGRLTAATVNGQPATLDPADGSIRLPAGAGRIDFTASVQR